MSNTKVLRREPNSVTFSDPLDPNFTVRFKTTTSPKSVDGLRLQNYVTEIIINDSVAIIDGTKTVRDPISARIKCSGSPEGHQRLKAILLSAASQLDEWIDEDVLLGYEVVTAPINPPKV